VVKKQFYVVKRKDKLTLDEAGKLKPTYYCRLHDENDDLLTWVSTGETARTRGENWALAEIEKRKKRKPGSDVSLQAFASDFFIRGRCSFLKRQEAKGRPVSEAWARAKRQMLVNHVFPVLGKTRLDRLTRLMIERFLVDLHRAPQTLNHVLYAFEGF
jgi:hypothetical protein